MYKRIENNSENNRQYLPISRRGPIHTCTVDAVHGEKMACSSLETHSSTSFDERIWSSSRSILEDYMSTSIMLDNITNSDLYSITFL